MHSSYPDLHADIWKKRREPPSLSFMRVTGLEPARLTVKEPKSFASANSAIPAWHVRLYFLQLGLSSDMRFISIIAFDSQADNCN